MAEVAGIMLVSAADVLEAAKVEDDVAQEMLKANAQVCRALAAALRDAPFGNSASILSAADLEGRFYPESQRVWTNATVAAHLLTETARLVETARSEDLAALERLTESAATIREIATLLDLAPGGRVGTRLNEILPYLRKLHMLEKTNGRPKVSPNALETATADPVFQALCEDAFQAKFGRKLSDSAALTQRHWTYQMAGVWTQPAPELAALDEAEVEQIRHALSNPRHDWCRRPLVEGRWSDLAFEDALAVLCLISAYHRAGQSATPFALAWFCDRVRSRPLSCFGGGAVLVETQGQPEPGTCGIASFVITDHDAWLVNGESDWIHDLNAEVGSHLFEPEARIEYLRLFMNCVRNDGERFHTLESPGDLDDRTEDETARAHCAAHARPIAAEGFDDEGRWLYRSVVVFAGKIFSSALAMSSDGMLEMTEEAVIEEDVAVSRERMIGPFVVLNGD